MELIKTFYTTVFYERADPRVKDWPLMTSPWPLAFLLSTYMVLIKVIIPAYMKNRPPFELRTVIRWYNVGQIVANTIVTWGIMTSGWTTNYHFGCLLPDYSTNPEPMRMLRFLWWTLIIKIAELVETVFFMLRKRDRQVSFLHVHHHISSSIMIWAGVKYVGGGLTSFPPMLNNAIHVVMYSYYLLSVEGTPKIRKFLYKYKKWLTIIQMVQFTVILAHSSQVFLPSCPAPLGVAVVFFPNVIVVYYMFVKFFKQNYVKHTGKHILNGNDVKKTLKCL